MDTATSQWPQIVLKSMEGMEEKPGVGEKRPRPERTEALNCPRCNSTNTKFCYYNNYSLSQPRYFCKTCRRYWTQGGTLRNIPVGGGSRKNKQKILRRESDMDLPMSITCPSMHSQPQQVHDLNLGFPKSNNLLISVSDLLPPHSSPTPIPSTTSIMPVEHHAHAPSFPSVFQFMPDFKAGIDFNLDLMGGFGNNTQDGSGSRLLFPFDNLKTGSDRHPGQTSSGYWTGMW